MLVSKLNALEVMHINNVKITSITLFLIFYFVSLTSFASCETKFHATSKFSRIAIEDFDAARKAFSKARDNPGLNKKTRCKQFESARYLLQLSIKKFESNNKKWNAIYNTCNPPVSLKARNAEKEITLEIMDGEKILGGLLKLSQEHCYTTSFKD